MARASDNVFPKLILAEGAAPSTPPANQVKLYAKADGLLYSKDDAGVETLMSSGPAGAPPDADYGDIVVSGSGTVWSLDSGVVTAAAKTVLDDATVGDMVDTLGGAASTGTGGLVRKTNAALVTPDLGTPSAATLTNATGLPVATGISGLAAGVATFLATPSSANLAAALTDETGSGKAVFDTSPTLVTPVIGAAAGTSLDLGTADPMTVHLAPVNLPLRVNADAQTGIELHTHSASAAVGPIEFLVRSRGSTAVPAVVQSGDACGEIYGIAYDGTDYEQLGFMRFAVDGTPGNDDMPGRIEFGVTPDGGITPAVAVTISQNKAVTLAVPLAAGSGGTGLSSLGAGVATFLGTPSSANLAAAVTDETGSGALVFATSPTLVTPALGTPASGTLTNCTGLPVATGISGLAANVATALATPSSANIAAACTDETGSGALVFATSPTLVTPALGTPASGTLTACMGPLASDYWFAPSGDRGAFANNTNLQALFTDVSAAGAISLPLGTYQFECDLYIDGMSGTSGNGKFELTVGTAVIAANPFQTFVGGDFAANGTPAAIGGSAVQSVTSGTNVVSLTTQTALWLRVRGMFRVTTAGTVIPSFALTTGVGTAVRRKNSWWHATRIGDENTQSVGTVS